MRYLTITILMAYICMSTLPSYAVTIDFEDYSGGQNIDSLNLGGVTLTNPDHGIIEVMDDFPSASYHSATKVISSHNSTHPIFYTDPIVGIFDSPQSYVSLWAGDSGHSSVSDYDSWELEAFDAIVGGNSLGLQQSGEWSGNPYQQLTIDTGNTDIWRFEARWTYPSVFGLAYDDLEFGVPESDQSVYGLFIGVVDTSLGHNYPTRGDIQAQEFHDILCQNISNFRQLEPNILTGDAGVLNMGVTIDNIENALDKLKENIKANDKLVVYLAGHGTADGTGTETTWSEGEEKVDLGDYYSDAYEGNMQTQLTDDDLTYYLGEYLGPELKNVEKWVFVDSCHSGGFWGDLDNPLADQGDLEKLFNIALFAAAPEWLPAISILGRSIWGQAVTDGFSPGPFGTFWADLNFDGNIAFNELSTWLLEYPEKHNKNLYGTLGYEMEFGDPVVFTEDMWSPVVYVSDDFTGLSGGLDYEVIPTPGAMAMAAVGLVFFRSFIRKMKRT